MPSNGRKPTARPARTPTTAVRPPLVAHPPYVPSGRLPLPETPLRPGRLTGPVAAGQAEGLPSGGRLVDPRAACQQAVDAGLVIHRADPLNAETPLPLLGGKAVPSGPFYVRNHFGIPGLDPATWRLEVGGLAGRPLSLSLAELRAMPSKTAVVTLECAGNGRSVLDPPVPGERWGLGAVGTAAWTGVPLTDVLEAAAPQPTAQEAVFRGADSGRPKGATGRCISSVPCGCATSGRRGHCWPTP